MILFTWPFENEIWGHKHTVCKIHALKTWVYEIKIKFVTVNHFDTFVCVQRSFNNAISQILTAILKSTLSTWSTITFQHCSTMFSQLVWL